MRQSRTIRFRLSLALLQVFLLIAGLALVSLWRLTDYHRTAGDIHDRYLPATQFLGDLSTLTSEFHALEAMALLPAADPDRRTDHSEIDNIDLRIADDLASYEAVPPQPDILPLYQDFADKWRTYRGLAGQTLTLTQTRPAEAAAFFRGASRQAYDAAADALWLLSQQTRLAADTASRRTELSYGQALWLTIAAIGLGGLILLGGIVHIRRTILLPLARLSRAMRQLAASDMEIGLEQDRGDEIGDMAQAVGIFRQNAITLNEKLAQEKKLAEMQSNFFSMASHEFRTPLTIIDGHAQRLINRQDRIEEGEIAERSGKIRQAVARMTGVIGTLIDSARLMEAPEAQFSRFDLTPLLREVAQLYRDMTPRVRIVEEIPDGALAMTGDPKLIFQLFSNILSNAVKYSGDSGTIRIQAEERGDKLVVGIVDEGVGIPAEDLDRLFERYFRGSNVSGMVGTGIGLHLVRVVLDLHGGDIAVESKVGEGARFTVSLPREAA